LAAPLLLGNTLSLRELVEAQQGYWFGAIAKWNVFQAPFPLLSLAFLLFMIAGFAETNRIPFDLPEAENELVAGFHTEYSSMKFAAFFMAEYCNMVTICAVATTLFLGGWLPPFPDAFGAFLIPSILFAIGGAVCLYHGMNPARPKDRLTLPVFGIVFLGLAALFQVPFLKPILQPLFWFAAKTGFLLFTFIWIRGTLPRFRYDQLMRFAWGFMFPVSVVNLLAVGLWVALF
jgi:NADH-quinone oxidoreductase subunit H